MRSFRCSFRRPAVTLAAVALLWPLQVTAQMDEGGDGSSGAQQPSRRPPDSSMTVRVYDVADLIVPVPDYEYLHSAAKSMGRGLFSGMTAGGSAMPGTGHGLGPGLPGMPGFQGGMRPGPTVVRQPGSATSVGIGVDDLVTAITHTCGGTSWQESGGRGAAEVLGYALVVLQTQDVHKQIEEFLSQLREGSNNRRIVMIDALWVELTSDEVRELTGSEGRFALDDLLLEEFRRRPTSIRALTTCFSGQLVYLASGARQNVVTSLIPAVGSVVRPDKHDAQYARRDTHDDPLITISQQESVVVDPEAPSTNVGYQTVTEKWHFGAILEIRPTLVSGGKTAIVDLRSTTTAPAKPEAVLAVTSSQAAGIPQIDRVAIDLQELATTLRVPVGMPVVVGGVTHVAASSPAAAPTGGETHSASPAPQETPQLYLILKLEAPSE